MKKILQKIVLWIYIKVHSIMINISIALFNTEIDLLKADPNDLQESDKKITRKLHHNPLLEKFFAGQTDEKYVKDYYEILKKSDKFMRTATPHKMAVAADKHGTNYGMKDHYGRRYEHYGFFDDKHKNSGKTIGEVLAIEFEERRTKDDDFELLYIFNNKPIEVGLTNIMDVLEKTDEKNDEYQVVDVLKKSKQFKFPIKIYRDIEVYNKIEELSEYLHVKKIGFEHRLLEFFIPKKFKTFDIQNNSDIFNEILNIKYVYVKNEYGESLGFNIVGFEKRIMHNDTYEVWKFVGIEMENITLH